jgi:glycerate 2-kinase
VAGLEIPRSTRVHIIGIGKAAMPMAVGAVSALAENGATLVGGVLVAPPPASPAPDTSLRVVTGDHPIPAARSEAAAAAIADAASLVQPDERVLALISGGGSSLAAAPAPEVPGLTQADLSALYEALLASGADIHLVNAVRKRFVRWTGGRLAVALAPARVNCLAVSDIPGDDVSMISSGPCVADPVQASMLVAALRSSSVWSWLPGFAQRQLDDVAHGRAPETPKSDAPAFRHVSARVIVSNRHALEAAAARARAAGIDDVAIEPTLLTGEAAIVGVRTASDLIARRKRARGPRITRCVLWGGETTVTIGDATAHPTPTTAQPLGGRSQELALAAARSLADAGDQAAGITILAAGTEGRDGPTDAAGAIIDRSTWSAITSAGRDPATDLAAHDAYRALDAAKVLLRPGLTGTNVMDLVIGLLL